jgi:hypothetical protein
VNEFVEECRAEWKRLGVPDPVADEMAADLAADLAEAEAEGVSAEAVLGNSVFDPRSFAAAWAAERGVIRQPPPNGRRLPRRWVLAVLVGAFALIAAVGGALIVTSPSSPARLALTGPGGNSPPGDPSRAVLVVGPDGSTVVAVDPSRRRMGVGSGRIWVSPMNTPLRTAPPPFARIVAVDVDDSGADRRALGWVLLAVGLAGVVPWTVFWLAAGRGRTGLAS